MKSHEKSLRKIMTFFLFLTILPVHTDTAFALLKISNFPPILDSFRILRRNITIRREGLKRYEGGTKDIIDQIIKSCWNSNNNYFQVSSGNFKNFFTRDFGIVCKALIELGYREEVKQTLEYALEKFEKHGHVTVAISENGRPFDFPTYAPDSLAFLLNSLSLVEDKELVYRYRHFLNSEIDYFFDNVIDKSTGLVRKDRFFSSMKDYAKRKSSCYDNCMAFLIQKNSEKLGLNNPLRKYNYKELIKNNFWNGNYFLDDLSGKDYVASDAQIFPFWVELFDEREMFESIKKEIEKNYLNDPLPMRYTKSDADVDMFFVEVFNKGYQKDTIWSNIGMIWLEVLYKFDRDLLNEEIEKYDKIIAKYGNFLEVYNSDLTPFKSSFYFSDDSMIWSAIFLNINEKMQH